MNENAGRKRRLKQTAVFFVTAILVFLAASVFLTESGIERLYPLAVRTQVETVAPSGNSYTVYQTTRANVASCDVIVVGIDPDIAQSYDVLGHFARFAKQYSEIGAFLLAVDEKTAAEINAFLSDDSGGILKGRQTLLQSCPGLSVDFIDFVTELAYVNATMTPGRKYTVESIYDANGEVSIDRLVTAAAEQTEQQKTCFAVVDGALLEDKTFSEELASQFGEDLLTVKMRYSGSNAEGATALQLPFTGSGTQTYFVSCIRLLDFNHYANKTLNFFRDGENIDYAKKISGFDWKDFFFVIANGTPVVYDRAQQSE